MSLAASPAHAQADGGAAVPPGGFTRVGAAVSPALVAVHEIAQDRRGALWVGTEDGLVRYDGTQARLFVPVAGDTTALGDAFVRGLLPGRADDALWVWTSPGGLQRLDTRTGRVRRIPLAPHLVPGQTVFGGMDWGPDGHLWVAGSPALVRVDVGRGRAVSLPQPRVPITVSDLDAGARFVWVATEQGLWRADARAATAGLRAVSLPPGAGRPESVLESPDGRRLFVGTERGVLVAPVAALRDESPPAPGTWTWHARAPQVRRLALDGMGALWVSSMQGLFRQRSDGHLDHYRYVPGHPRALPSTWTGALLVDRSGTLWVGTLGNGVAAYPTRPRVTLVPGPGGEAAPAVTSVEVRADGQLWLAGSGGTICRAAPSGRCGWRTEGTLPHGMINGLYEAPGGTLYAAGWEDGLWHLPPGATRLARVPGLPAALLYPRQIDGRSDGALYVSGADALFRYLPGRGWDHVPGSLRPSTDSLHLYTWPLVPEGGGAAGEGGVWVGSMGGGLYFVPDRHVPDRHVPVRNAASGFRRLVATWDGGEGDARATLLRLPMPLRPGARAARITALARTPDGSVWAATMNDGLARANRATLAGRGPVRRYGAADGLASPTVNALAVDARGRLWAFTSGTASRYDATLDRFVSVGVAEGMPDANPYFDGARTGRDGRLLVGTPEGLLVFHPDSLGQSATPPRVWLSSAYVDGRLRTAAPDTLAALDLGPDERIVGVDLSAGDPGPLRTWTYAYRLGGSGDERERWQSLGTRTRLDLGALAPGRYTLAVRAATAGGAGRETTLALVVHPPWWQTLWARTLGALLLLGALGLAYRVRVTSLLRLERTRRRIADDLHDDLGSKLSTLATQLEVAGRYGDDPPAALVRSATVARGLVVDLRDAVWAIDGQRDTAESLVERLETVAYDLLGPERARFDRPRVLPAVPLAMERRRHVFLLVKEALHNAHRHAAPAAVTLRVTWDGVVLALEVADDGPGFDPAAVQRGQGLAASERRAAAARASFRVASTPGAGTTVRVDLTL